ncbi:MAG: ATP synthase F1 subunit epsilon [Oscillospiraceae bacterium]|nr:ATP synthase F1 subunit epsilon [Oscillospiraceae bacterium]
MNTFTLEIVATDTDFYQGPCEMLTVTAVDGEKGILQGHEPMVMALAAGELRYTVDGKQHIAAVGDGFAEITGDKVVIISDFAEKPEDIDAKRAERDKIRAEERLKANESAMEYARAQAELSHAIARLKVIRKTLKQ